MKQIHLILTLLLAGTLLNNNAVAKEREVLHFSHTYKGITTGQSTEKEVQRKLGKPLEKTNYGRNYVYKNMTINFEGKKIKKVNTITLTNNNPDADKNGVRLGDAVSVITKSSNELVSMGNTIIDNTNGIIYWLDNKRVSKIVLANSFYKATQPDVARYQSSQLSPIGQLPPIERKKRKIVSRLYTVTEHALNICPKDKKAHFQRVLNDFEKRTGQVMPLARSSIYWSNSKSKLSNYDPSKLSNKKRSDYCRLSETYYLKSIDKKMADEFVTLLSK